MILYPTHRVRSSHLVPLANSLQFQWLTTGRNSCPLCRGQGVEEVKKAGDEEDEAQEGEGRDEGGSEEHEEESSVDAQPAPPATTANVTGPIEA